MSAPACSRRAMVLLWAALAHPAWALAHAAVHEHLALHHAEASHPLAEDGHRSATCQKPAAPGHGHDHDHLVVVFVRATRGSDLPSLAMLPALPAGTHLVYPGRWRLDLDAVASHGPREGASASAPRGPPIA